MIKFLIVYSEKNNEKYSDELDKDHEEFLQIMQKYLLFFGSLPELGQYFLIIKEESKKKALDIVYRDPYIQAQVYQTFKLTRIF